MIKKKGSTPKWIIYSIGIVLALAVVLTIIYVIQCQNRDDEFASAKDFFGEDYDQIFEGNQVDKDISEPLIRKAEAALSYIGTSEEIKVYGPLSRYCTDIENYPTADHAEYSLDILAGNTQNADGFLWVAYTQEVYDKGGKLLCGSGSEDHRVLSRWTLKKVDDVWTVTEIKELP